MSKRLILFVCTGNVCRSPMAEYMLRDKMGPETEWRVASAGLSAGGNMRASRFAVDVMSELDIDLERHRSRRLTREMAEKADLIITMTTDQRDQINRMYPSVGPNLHLLHEFDPKAKTCDVDDPIGGTENDYRLTRLDIAASLPGLMEFLKAISKSRKR